jgi:hypothetical protein
MLLLLGVASLVPVCEDEYACDWYNNFAQSLQTMVTYPQAGPPI